MARKVRFVSDSNLAAPHASGSKVQFVLPCIHDELGPLWVSQVGHASVHAVWAGQLRGELTKLEARIEALPIQSSGGRQVGDADLVANLYLVGSNIVIHTVLLLHHLVLRLEALSPASTGREDIKDRLNAVLRRLGYRGLTDDPRYPALSEILRVRDAIEHPSPENTFIAEDTSLWDRVPLTWIAAGRAGKTFDQAIKLLEDISAFATKVERRRKGTRTLHVRRGIKALNPAKKPRQ